MGMAASQARLLSITARLSNNEMEQQSVAYSKQRLSDNSEQINDAYLDALAKTKYQVLTGYNGSDATYADLSYNQLTSFNSVAAGKQYLVQDHTGKVLVNDEIAKAYQQNNGDFNRFIRDLGYTQADIDVTKRQASEDAIHNAWDMYLASVGKSIDNYEDGQHILGFDFTAFSNDSLDGYVTYATAYATENATGDVQYLYKDSTGYYRERHLLEAREVTETVNGQTKTDVEVGYFYGEDAEGNPIWNAVKDVDYNTETGLFTYTNLDGEAVDTKALFADPDDNLISENPRNYLDVNGVSEGGVAYDIYETKKALNFEGSTVAQRELFDYATALTEAYYNNQISATTQNLTYDANIVNYYKNIFNEMRTKGYTTVDDEAKLKDNDWFVRQLKAGKLQLSYFSTVEKSFVATGLDSDESITQKEDSSAMAIAEQVYQNAMDKIERQDKQFDLQLNKLESEHSALSTEYDSVKNIIKKNVEKSFNIFNA